MLSGRDFSPFRVQGGWWLCRDQVKMVFLSAKRPAFSPVPLWKKLEKRVLGREINALGTP